MSQKAMQGVPEGLYKQSSVDASIPTMKAERFPCQPRITGKQRRKRVKLSNKDRQLLESDPVERREVKTFSFMTRQSGLGPVFAVPRGFRPASGSLTPIERLSNGSSTINARPHWSTYQRTGSQDE